MHSFICIEIFVICAILISQNSEVQGMNFGDKNLSRPQKGPVFNLGPASNVFNDKTIKGNGIGTITKGPIKTGTTPNNFKGLLPNGSMSNPLPGPNTMAGFNNKGNGLGTMDMGKILAAKNQMTEEAKKMKSQGVKNGFRSRSESFSRESASPESESSQFSSVGSSDSSDNSKSSNVNDSDISESSASNLDSSHSDD